MKEKNNSGFALIIALVLLVTLPILAMAIANLSLNASKTATINDKKTKAYYLARSGAEAVISAWKDKPIDNRPTGSIKPIIYDSNSNFIVKEKFNNNPGNYGDKVAKISVSINENQDGTTSFISTATINKYSKTVTATVSAHKKAINEDWYDKETINGNEFNIINSGPYDQDITLSSDFWEWLTGNLDIDYDKKTVNIKYHDEIYGTVEIGTNDETMKLKNYNYDHEKFNKENKIAFIAKNMYINNSLDLRQETAWEEKEGFLRDYQVPHGRQGALTLIADTIVFKNKIDLNQLFLSYGSLVLTLPEKAGFKLKDKNNVNNSKEGLYGKVYFKDDVILHGITDFTEININFLDPIINKMFFFFLMIRRPPRSTP